MGASKRVVDRIIERIKAGEPWWTVCGDYVTLVDIAAIADRLDVPKDTVNKWRHRGLLPEPDFPLTVGPVWEWETIRQWAKETGRTS